MAGPLSAALLDRLAPDQRAAATASSGPGLCVAPAGSGKTTTLVARIAWLIDQGIPADLDLCDHLQQTGCGGVGHSAGGRRARGRRARGRGFASCACEPFMPRARDPARWEPGPVARAFIQYEGALADEGGLDFDDLVARALRLLVNSQS